MKNLNKLGGSLSLALSLCAAPQLSLAANNTFSNEQTKAIEKIVHDYLVANPEVLYEVSAALESKQREEISDHAQTVIQANQAVLFKAQSPTAGNAKASVVLVEFFDYQCGHCKTMSRDIKKLLAQDNDLKVIYKELPIFGATSEVASKAALAANKQGKYSELHTAFMQASGRFADDKQVLAIAKKIGLDMQRLETDMASAEIKAELEQNLRLAQELRLPGTPAFIIASQVEDAQPHSVFLPGAVGIEALEKAIQQVRS